MSEKKKKGKKALRCPSLKVFPSPLTAAEVLKKQEISEQKFWLQMSEMGENVAQVKVQL